MKKLFILLLIVIPCMPLFSEWQRDYEIEKHFESFKIYSEIWINHQEMSIILEDTTSKDENELLYNINYILTIYSFFIEDGNEKLLDYDIIYLYYINHRDKEYRLDIVLSSGKENILLEEDQDKTSRIIKAYGSAKEKFKNKYYRSIREIWMLNNIPIEQSLQSSSSIRSQSLESFKK